MQITVIGYTQKMNTFLEKVALAARPHSEHVIIRCQEPTSLKGLVGQAGGKYAHVLNLVGHARPDEPGLVGHFMMGDAPLLEMGQEPPEAFKGLDDTIPRNATVRLLGCYTSELIQIASTALNGREVIGVTKRLLSEDFDEGGLQGGFPHLLSTNPDFLLRSVERPEPEFTEELEAARKWRPWLPTEYQVVGRGAPLAQVEASRTLRDAEIFFACGRRLVLIQDEPMRSPLVLEWEGTSAPPPLQELLAALPNPG